jgi:3-oxoacyl-[acyl-carrier-protein] synthase-3
VFAAIRAVEYHLPDGAVTNEDLAAAFPDWSVEKIAAKTGIARRPVAAAGERASDLAAAAARKLFDSGACRPDEVDFLLLCTQSPDQPLPTTACVLQDRLGLPTTAGALDFNLGCSGYVYGLSLADGLIRSGAAKRVLLLTAETYSKYIHPTDRSLRTIFGDGAAATLVESAPEPSLSAFQFGTDGSGADTLLVCKGGARPPEDAIKPRHRQRWESSLYMDGPSLITFTVAAVPLLIENILAAAKLADKDVDLYLFHQATRKMLDQLRERMGISEERLPMVLENCGNTVSATIPILIHTLRSEGQLKCGMHNMLVGFGVGWSWAGCMWRETWGK